MSSDQQQENEPDNRANAVWMAGFGIVAMELGVALVVMSHGAGFPDGRRRAGCCKRHPD